MLATSLVLILMFWQWRPIPAVVWQVPYPELAVAIQVLSIAGIALVLVATFLINHFELFGLHQVFNNLTGRQAPEVRFKTPSLYKVVRHPIYLGFIIAFWAAPVMTVGHLLFAVMTTGYIFVGIFLEERDLVAHFGDDYRRYRERVSMIVPFLGGVASVSPSRCSRSRPSCPARERCREGPDRRTALRRSASLLGSAPSITMRAPMAVAAANFRTQARCARDRSRDRAISPKASAIGS